MFRFEPDDEGYQPQPVPAALVIPALREVLQAIERRTGSSEQHLIDQAMALSAGWDHWPTHTVWAPPTVVVTAAQKGAQG